MSASLRSKTCFSVMQGERMMNLEIKQIGVIAGKELWDRIGNGWVVAGEAP